MGARAEATYYTYRWVIVIILLRLTTNHTFERMPPPRRGVHTGLELRPKNTCSNSRRVQAGQQAQERMANMSEQEQKDLMDRMK